MRMRKLGTPRSLIVVQMDSAKAFQYHWAVEKEGEKTTSAICGRRPKEGRWLEYASTVKKATCAKCIERLAPSERTEHYPITFGTEKKG